MNPTLRITGVTFCLLAPAVLPGAAQTPPGSTSLELAVLEGATGLPVPCRIHLREGQNRPVQASGLPFWWDMPLWLASGQVDSVGIVQNHMQRSGVLDSEAWGRARNREQYPGLHGDSR